MGGLGSVGVWVAWVHKNLAWVEYLAWVAWMAWVTQVYKILTWMVWVYKMFLWIEKLGWVKDNVNILYVSFAFIT